MQMNTMDYLEKEFVNIKGKYLKNFAKQFLVMFFSCVILICLLMHFVFSWTPQKVVLSVEEFKVIMIVCGGMAGFMSLIFAVMINKSDVINKHKYEHAKVNTYDAFMFLTKKKASKKTTDAEIKNMVDRKYEGFLLEILGELRNKTEDMSDYVEQKKMLEKEFANKMVFMDTQKVFTKLILH